MRVIAVSFKHQNISWRDILSTTKVNEVIGFHGFDVCSSELKKNNISLIYPNKFILEIHQGRRPSETVRIY